MFSFTSPLRPQSQNSEYYYDEKKPRRLSKILKSLKSCFSSHNFDVQSRKDYTRTKEAATGFEGEEIYGFEAEYLDDDDMAWGSRSRPSRREKRQKRQRIMEENHHRACW